MKLLEAIARADALAPNVIEPKVKAQWLHEINYTIAEIMGAGEVYNAFPTDYELCCPEPYDDLYPLYCASHIFMQAQEWDNYNNISTLFNQRLSEFKTHWIQNNPSPARRWKL